MVRERHTRTFSQIKQDESSERAVEDWENHPPDGKQRVFQAAIAGLRPFFDPFLIT